MALEAPAGLIDGMSSVNKFGRTTNVDSGQDTDIWDGARTPANRIWVAPTIAQIHDITSDDNSDRPASDGMHTMRIFGLDSNFEQIQEDITLNGTTSVQTVNSYIRIYRAYGLTWGSQQQNDGNISIEAQTDGTITAEILEGNNQTLMAIYSVPADYTYFITKVWYSLNRNSPSNVSFDFRLLVKNNIDVANSGYNTKLIQGGYINNNYVSHEYNPYIKINEKSDIVVRAADCTDNNTDVSAGFDGYLVSNDLL